MKVLIVEDEDAASGHLQRLLKNIDSDIEIVKTIDSVKNTIAYLEKLPPVDLIFLDIQLADGLSFDIFREVQVKIPVIFTTAYDKYALKAFELNSIDYLLKPIDRNKLETGLNKYYEIKEHYSSEKLTEQIKGLISSYATLESNYKNRFLINKADELIPVNTDEIAFFYAEDKAVFLVTLKGNRYIINFSLDHLDNSLDPVKFFRINRHQILSVKNIGKIHSYFNYRLKVDPVVGLDQEFIVSRLKVNDFKQWLS